MKIALTGKGGVGKSTIAAALAILLAEKGGRVVALDADPDANLASSLGIPHEEQKKIVTISEQIDLHASKHQLLRRVFSRENDTKAHCEHERMRNAEIIAKDILTEEEEKLFFVSRIVDTESDHRMAYDHTDDRQRLQQLQFVSS